MRLLSIFVFLLITLSSSAQNTKLKQLKQRLEKEESLSFNEFSKKVNDDFNSFRAKVNAEFSEAMEKTWGDYLLEEAKPVPKEEPLPPVIFEDDGKFRKDLKITPIVVEPPLPIFNVPQPQPLEPVIENDEESDYQVFTFYGTEMKARWGDLSQFKLAKVEESAFSKGYRQLTSKDYNNLLYDCIQLRKNYNLCDWAYFKMLEALTNKACGKGTNEAVFAQGVLLNQSGYRIRFGYDAQKHQAHILICADSYVYGNKTLILNGVQYTVFSPTDLVKLKVFDHEYTGEKALNLSVAPLPQLALQETDIRTIKSRNYNVEVTSRLNKNLIDFMNEYPTSYCNNDFITRWAYYANTPLSNEVKEQLYPQLKEKIKDANQTLAANILLNWVQTGFVYEYDDKVWGKDRAFFAEESLYYPYCDCEDRAILYSHLVRDLIGLDVLLVYYPNHLATAVNFTENVEKVDYIEYKSRRFVICDPTYINAPIGWTMRGCDNKEAKVILLNR